MNYAEARAEVIRYGQLLVEHRLIQAKKLLRIMMVYCKIICTFAAAFFV